MVATFTSLAIALGVLLLVLYVRRRRKAALQAGAQRSAASQKFQTTLGEFHEMREALRPLEHKRSASRRDTDLARAAMSASAAEVANSQRSDCA